MTKPTAPSRPLPTKARNTRKPSGIRARAGAATRLKLILAAESLIGTRGVDAVSLREISTAAKQTNSAAAQYHLGHKDQVIQAIFEYRTVQLEAMRAAMIEKLETREQERDVKSLVKILCYPFLMARDADGRFSYAAFMCQFLTRMRLLGVRHPSDAGDTTPALNKLKALFIDSLSHLDDELAWRRVAMGALVFCSMLVRWASAASPDRIDELKLVVMDTIEQIAAALCAPMGKNTDERLPIPL